MFDRHIRGLSLIETLVVLVIIGVLTTLVVLTLSPRPSDQGPSAHLRQVAQAIDGVCERALFQARAQRLVVHAKGLGWWDQSGVADQPTAFKPLVDWPQDWRVSLSLEGLSVPILDNVPTEPSGAQIICGVMGERSAFNLVLANGQEQAELQMSASGRLGQWTIAVDQ